MIGTLGAAVVTGVVTIVVQYAQREGAAEGTPNSISYGYSGDYTNSEVTVNGSATGGVDEVAILVGPRSAGGKYWVDKAKVVDGVWDVTVKTDPNLPKQYEVQAIPHFGSHNLAVGGTAMKLYSFDPGDTSTPDPSPQDPLQCATQNGAGCFTGPGWGAPVIRRSDQ